MEEESVVAGVVGLDVSLREKAESAEIASKSDSMREHMKFRKGRGVGDMLPVLLHVRDELREGRELVRGPRRLV